MKSFKVIEHATITVKRVYYVEAENREDAFDMVASGQCEIDYEVETGEISSEFEVDERW